VPDFVLGSARPPKIWRQGDQCNQSDAKGLIPKISRGAVRRDVKCEYQLR
jgi:hypothetical protein